MNFIPNFCHILNTLKYFCYIESADKINKMTICLHITKFTEDFLKFIFHVIFSLISPILKDY